MRLLTLSSQEAILLTREIKGKYEALSGEELIITSYLARYEGLADLMKAKTQCFDGIDVVSPGLLRKLLESGKRQESTKINRQFIDACYLFISDCQFARTEYNERVGTSTDQEATNEASARSVTWPFKGEKINLSIPKDAFILSTLVVTALLVWVLAANWQYLLLQVPTPAPKYLWWVAEYPDGTKVYNNFRRYRTEKDVIDHFMGHGLEDGTRTGDCNAIYWRDGSRMNVCYDNAENIRKFEEQHGGKPEIRFDG